MDYGRFVEQQKRAEMERRYPLTLEGLVDTGMVCRICGCDLDEDEAWEAEADGNELCLRCKHDGYL